MSAAVVLEFGILVRGQGGGEGLGEAGKGDTQYEDGAEHFDEREA